MSTTEREPHDWGTGISPHPTLNLTGRSSASATTELPSPVSSTQTTVFTPYNASAWETWGKHTPMPDSNLSEVAAVPGFISPQNISFDEGVPLYLPDWDNLTNCDWNDTLCYSPDSMNVTAQPDTSDPKFWAIILTLFPLFTVFGNVLVVLSVYKERSLQTVTNYFIVSLAVADIMVAVLVMPLAIYVEVYAGVWFLGNALCDTWVALDVMCCTASILNLTAISVDRFIAVTQPIRYAKHKNSKRVHVMLAVTWIISLAISSPIALGMNYTTRRSEDLCVFYNADFLIYSSMGSFYIPCVIMILLYWRIFRAIHLRAKKARKQRAMHKPSKPVTTTAISSVIENRAQTQCLTTTTSDASAAEDGAHRELLPAGHSARALRTPATIAEETSFTNYNAKLSTTEPEDTEQEEHNGLDGGLKSPMSDDNSSAHVIPNDKSTEFILSPTSDEGAGHVVGSNSGGGYSAPSCVEVRTNVVVGSPTSPLPSGKSRLLSPGPRPGSSSPIVHRNNHTAEPPPTNQKNNNVTPSPKKSVTKFNFHLRHSKKKKDRSATRRERKATKTLAIVLGVFLLCWVPFFTINIINAICIRYDLFATQSVCNIHPILFSFFIWLGYINSFLNPVIYTIFNIEFRKAFKKLLSEPACK